MTFNRIVLYVMVIGTALLFLPDELMACRRVGWRRCRRVGCVIVCQPQRSCTPSNVVYFMVFRRGTRGESLIVGDYDTCEQAVATVNRFWASGDNTAYCQRVVVPKK